MYPNVGCEVLINTGSPRITQLGLVKPEYHLNKTFSIATSFEKEKFEQSPDRVCDPPESRFIS